jgi:hypothetical protein
MLPNVIIGGTQKAGTTSLFRYLSDHPSVCPSLIKEVDFFLKYRNKIDEKAIKKYGSYFSNCSSDKPIRLEASPSYLKFSDSIAATMYNYLPNIKLIFILREPVSVLLSYLTWKSTSIKESMTISQIISLIDKSHYNAENEYEITKIRGRLFAGCYATKLEDYLAFFPKNAIGIFFYDDLAKNIQAFMETVCRYLNLDNNFYQNYQFHIENKTRLYKYPAIHRLVSRLYLKFEFFFNRYPLCRHQLRILYNLFCEASETNGELKESQRIKLNEFYVPHNRNLHRLLKQEYPDLQQPAWLKNENNHVF